MNTGTHCFTFQASTDHCSDILQTSSKMHLSLHNATCQQTLRLIAVLPGSQAAACSLRLSTLSPRSTVTQSKNFPLTSFRNPIFPLHPVRMPVINCASLLSNGTLIVFFSCTIEDKKRGGYYMLSLPLDKPERRDAPEDLAPAQGGEPERLSLNHPLQESRITYILRRCDTEVSSCGRN